MTGRHDRIVEAILKVADEFIVSSSYGNQSLWEKWEDEQKKLVLVSFLKYQRLSYEYLADPDVAKLLYDTAIWTEEFAARSVPSSEAKTNFYDLALPYMIRMSGARDIQWEAESKSGLQINAHENALLSSQWELLKQDETLTKRAWVKIGKHLTYRFFDELHGGDVRGRGRPEKLIKNKDVHIAGNFISLKRRLYKPFYELAPFDDKELVEALLSDSNNKKLKGVLLALGLSNNISSKSVRNMISAGRKRLPPPALIEDTVLGYADDGSEIADYFINEGISADDRIVIAEQDIGPLTAADKKAIRLGFSAPTEVMRALSKNDLREVDLEIILSWRLLPDEIQTVVDVAKVEFGLSCFKNKHAQNTTQDYW